jgi:hypothetical protein
MNVDETTNALKVRRDLTGESFNDGTITAWCEALGAWPIAKVRTAIVAAAREHQRVTVAHVVDHLPQQARPPATPPAQCVLCDGSGWVSVPTAQAHNPRYCHPTPERPCCCHAAEPCRCTTGQGMADVHRSILEHSDRTRPNWARDPAPDQLPL